MKLAFTINPLRTKEEINSFKEVLELGMYQGVEIFYPKADKRVDYTEGINSIKQEFPNLEFVMHLPYGGDANLCDLENYGESLNLLKEAISYANLFAVKKLTLHLGRVNKEIDRTIFINHIVKVLTDLCNYAKKYGMFVMIENMPGSGELGYSPKEILEIINEVNLDNLKFILDTGHANVSEYEIADYVNTLGDHLMHLHLNDNDGTKDQHAPFGSGNIDFEKFINLMEEINYQELYCLEIIFKDVEDLKVNAKALRSYKK